MNAGVGAIGKPQLFFIGRKRDAMAWAAMALGRTFLIAGYLDAIQHPSGLAVTHLKAEQLVDVDEAKRLAPIDGEGANRIAEGTYLVHNGVGFRVRHRKDGRAQAGKVNTGAIGSVNRVMRTGIEVDLCKYFSGLCGHDLPIGAFERRHLEYFSVGRDG